MDDKKFRYLVEQLRDAQKLYFAERTQSALTEAKRLEREVDAALKAADAAAHAPVERQAEMFDL